MVSQATGAADPLRPLGDGHRLPVARRPDHQRDALALVEERVDAVAAPDATRRPRADAASSARAGRRSRDAGSGSDTGTHRSGGLRRAVRRMSDQVSARRRPLVHCHEMTVNPTFLARSIRPTAAASSSAFGLITVVSTVRRDVAVAEDDVHQPVRRATEPKFDVQRSSSCLETTIGRSGAAKNRSPHPNLVNRSRQRSGLGPSGRRSGRARRPLRVVDLRPGALDSPD